MISVPAGQREAEALLPVDFAHTHLLTRVERYTLAIPIASVMSIHEAPLVFPTPCAQPGILGAIRFQGTAVPVFDLRRSLRLESRALQMSDRLVLVDAGMRIMALLVDEVLEFASLQTDTATPADELFGETPVNAKIIAGMACAPQLCAIIDPAGLTLPDVWEETTAQAILDEPLEGGDRLSQRTAALAEVPKPAQSSGVEAALFKIAGQRYGVPLSAIVEFFTDSPHSRIPVRASIAVSLLNRRGEAIMVFDPRPLLGAPAAAMPPRLDGIVLSGDRCKMAMPVDVLEGLGVLPHFDAIIRPGRFCLSVHPSDRGAVVLLDVPALLHSAQSAFAERPTPSTTANA